MILVIAIGSQLLHIALLLGAAPLLADVLAVVRARLLGRAGPPLTQSWRDLLRLARKQPVLPENASALFLAAPYAVFAATAAAASLVPSFALGMVLAPLSDLLVIAGLLAAARLTLALAALDVGTAAGGLGASRAMSTATFAEPALLLVFLTLALLAGSTNVNAVAALLREGGAAPPLPLCLALAALILVALAYGGRLPVDDAAAQSAPVLEFSGRHLALIEVAAALRLLLWLTLIATLVLPGSLALPAAGPLAWLAGVASWAAKVLVLAAALTVYEASVASLRAARAPAFLGMAMLLGLLAAMFLFLGSGFA